MSRLVRSAARLGLLVALGAATAGAQQAATTSTPAAHPRFSAALLAGVTQFDLSGTGSTGLLGVRLDTEVRRWLVAEGALGFFRPEEQSGTRSRYTVPELQLQLQLPRRVVRPYVGVGGGWVFASGGRDTRGTASAAAGLRLAVPRTALDARGELRVRGIGRSFGGSTAEWTLGVGYRF